MFTRPIEGWTKRRYPSSSGHRCALKNGNQIGEMRQGGWIRAGTRAVIVDLNIYNANENLFLSARTLFEFPVTGGVITYYEFRAVELAPFRYSNGYGLLACYVMMFLMCAFYLAQEVSEFRHAGYCLEKVAEKKHTYRHRGCLSSKDDVYINHKDEFRWWCAARRYFYDDAWNVIDLFGLTTLLFSLVMHLYAVAMYNLYEKSGELFNGTETNKTLLYLSTLHEYFEWTFSVSVLINTFRVLKYTQVSQRFDLLLKTLRTALLPLAYFCFILVVVLVGFALAFMVVRFYDRTPHTHTHTYHCVIRPTTSHTRVAASLRFTTPMRW